jgi:excisionase family DNA binding protein
MPGILIQEDGVATQHKVGINSVRRPCSSAGLGSPRAGSAVPAHLCGMSTATDRQARTVLPSEHGLDPVITMSQLASQLGVGVQTLYDLRSQGRGPRGFRVGRELRFRVSEIDSWLAQLEEADAERHAADGRSASRLGLTTQIRQRGVLCGLRSSQRAKRLAGCACRARNRALRPGPEAPSAEIASRL